MAEREPETADQLNEVPARVTLTSPGKAGDCLMEWPVAFWWHRETGKPFDLWLDQTTCRALKPLLEIQPGVQAVELKDGIQNWNCGGQPWNFGLETVEHEGRYFVHLGMRRFPTRQISLQTRQDVPLQLRVSDEDFAETPSLIVPEEPKANRVVLHGTSMTHTKSTPQFWKFLASIRSELEAEFEDLVFVGTERELRMAGMAYAQKDEPEWANGPWRSFRDGGDLIKTASLIQSSRLVIGAGSLIAALAGALKTACVRVHDPIGDHAKSIWSSLGRMQLNATEFELRTEWPPYFEELKGAEVAR